MSATSLIGGEDNVRAAATSRPGRLNAATGLVVRVVFSAGLLAAAFWLASDKLDWRQIARLDPLTLSICALLSLFIVWVLAWRWRQVALAAAGDRPDLPGILSFMRQTWLCLAVNQVLPSIVAGDALRTALLSRQGMPLGRAAGSVLLDRVYGLVGLALLTCASAFLLAPDLALPALAVALAVITGIGVLAFAARFFIREKLGAIIPASSIGWRQGVMLVAAAAVGHLANIALFLVIAHALGVDLPLFGATAVMCAVLLVGMLPLSIAGWGVRELALVQAFGHMGLQPDQIILSSVTYGLVLFIAQASGFLLFARRNRP